MTIPQEIKEKIESAYGGTFHQQELYEAAEFGYSLHDDEIEGDTVIIIWKDGTYKEVIANHSRDYESDENWLLTISATTYSSEVLRLQNQLADMKALIEKAFREGYARRNSNYFSRDWKEFCKENNIIYEQQ